MVEGGGQVSIHRQLLVGCHALPANVTTAAQGYICVAMQMQLAETPVAFIDGWKLYIILTQHYDSSRGTFSGRNQLHLFVRCRKRSRRDILGRKLCGFTTTSRHGDVSFYIPLWC